jgi:hypothetical protein
VHVKSLEGAWSCIQHPSSRDTQLMVIGWAFWCALALVGECGWQVVMLQSQQLCFAFAHLQEQLAASCGLRVLVLDHASPLHLHAGFASRSPLYKLHTAVCDAMFAMCVFNKGTSP